MMPMIMFVMLLLLWLLLVPEWMLILIHLRLFLKEFDWNIVNILIVVAILVVAILIDVAILIVVAVLINLHKVAVDLRFLSGCGFVMNNVLVTVWIQRVVWPHHWGNDGLDLLKVLWRWMPGKSVQRDWFVLG